MGKAGIFWVAVLAAGLGAAQASAQSMAASTDCRAFACRKPGAVTLRQEDGSSITARKLPYAYFDGSVVSLAPGDTVTLGYGKAGGKPRLVSVSDDAGPVNIGAAPAADMTLRLSLKPDGLTFFVGNTTSVPIGYRLGLYGPEDEIVEIAELRACLPAPKGQFPTYARSQTWLQPVGLILIGELELLPPDAC